jgi:hypothetical protein
MDWKEKLGEENFVEVTKKVFKREIMTVFIGTVRLPGLGVIFQVLFLVIQGLLRLEGVKLFTVYVTKQGRLIF